MEITGWKLPRGKINGKGDSRQTNLTGFLLKGGQGSKILRVGNKKFEQVSRAVRYQEWRMRKFKKYQG